MTMPVSVGVIDTLMEVRPLHGELVQHLFKRPVLSPDESGREGAELLLPHMDRHGIDMALIEVSNADVVAQRALREHPDRFLASFRADPTSGFASVRELVSAYENFGVRAVVLNPAFYEPQVPIDDRRMYPLYAKCVELDLPVFITVGVPGPAVEFDAQYVGRLDPVCLYFPTLTIVMRHGGLPWVDLAISLMTKWPNLHYSTTAMAPKHYPQAIVEFANKRGPERVIYGGHFPIGLSLDRIFAELPDVPFSEAVWPAFLRDNARRVLKLDPPARSGSSLDRRGGVGPPT